jgi:hypothetical protein
MWKVEVESLCFCLCFTLPSYRKHNEFLARTTSKNYVVRLLYYSVAICIYNCWCILNALQGQKRDGGAHIIVLEVKLILLFEFFSIMPM